MEGFIKFFFDFWGDGVIGRMILVLILAFSLSILRLFLYLLFIAMDSWFVSQEIVTATVIEHNYRPDRPVAFAYPMTTTKAQAMEGRLG